MNWMLNVQQSNMCESIFIAFLSRMKIDKLCLASFYKDKFIENVHTKKKHIRKTMRDPLISHRNVKRWQSLVAQIWWTHLNWVLIGTFCYICFCTNSNVLIIYLLFGLLSALKCVCVSRGHRPLSMLLVISEWQNEAQRCMTLKKLMITSFDGISF